MSYETEYPSTQDRTREELFIQLLTQSYRSLYAYARTLVPNGTDAEDCVQEASLHLWRKFDEFEEEGSFARWAQGFLRHVVKNYHRKARPRYLALDDELIDKLAVVQRGSQELLDLRREAVDDCLARLPERDRSLLASYHEHGESVAKLSRTFHRKPATIYKALKRARIAVARCVDRHVRRQQ